MNDRLMIAAMQLAALNSTDDGRMMNIQPSNYQWALGEATALLTAAGEKEDHVTTAYHDSIVSEANALMVTWKQRAESAESKLAACEGERDALKRRLEPLTEDEAYAVSDQLKLQDCDDRDTEQIVRETVAFADRIRARRA